MDQTLINQVEGTLPLAPALPEGKDLLRLFSQAPAAIALLQGPDHTYVFANPLYQRIFARTEAELIGRPLRQVFPEIEGQGIYEVFDEVYRSGTPFSADAFEARFEEEGEVKTAYFNFVIQPVIGEDSQVSSLMVQAYDVTKQVAAHRVVEDNELKYRGLFNAMNQGFCLIEVLFDKANEPEDYRFLEVNPVFIQQTGLVDTVGRRAKELLPDLELVWFTRFGHIAKTGMAENFIEHSSPLGRWFEVHAYRTGHPGQRQVAVLFTDITERKKQEEELARSRDLLQTIFDSSPHALLVLDPTFEEGELIDFRYLMSNGINNQLTGRTDLMGKRFSEAFPTAKNNGIFGRFSEVFRTGYPADFEQWYVGEGLNHWFRIRASRAGSLLVVNTENITEKKDAALALQQSEARFKAAVEAVEGVLWTNSPEGKMEGPQPGWEQLTGQSYQDYQGYGWAAAVHPEDAQATIDAWNEAVAGQRPFVFEHRLKTASGQWNLFSIRAIPILSEGGKISEWVGVHTNITEHRKAAEALRFRTALLEAQQNAIPDALLVVDTRGAMLSFNRHFATLWKIPDSIIAARDDNAALEVAMEQVLDPEGFIDRVHYCYAHPEEKVKDEVLLRDGRILERFGNAVTGENGEAYGWIWYFRDITEAKGAADRLRASEDRYQNFIRQSTEGIWRFELRVPLPASAPVEEQIDHFFQHAWLAECNDGMARMYGFEQASELAGLTLSDFFPHDADTEAYFRAFIGSDYRLHNIESKEIDRHGATRYFSNNLVGIIENGLLVRAWGTQRDVTERHLAEEKIKESEQRFQNLISSATVGIILLVGEEMRVEIVNEAYGRLIDRSATALLGKKLFDVIPEAEESFRPIIDGVRNSGEPLYLFGTPYFVMVEGVRKEGYLNLVYQPYHEPNGRVNGVMVLCQDVTAQVVAQQRVEESEARFRTLSNSIPQIVWMTDGEGRLHYLSRQWEDYTGQSVAEGLSGNRSLVHPDDLPLLAAQWTASLASGQPWKLDYRLRNERTGAYRWFSGNTAPLRDREGKILHWIGTATDIHEQKQFAEELEKLVASRTRELKRSNEDLQQFAHVASHDLKEPVRKVMTFSNRIKQEFGGEIPERAAGYLSKIEHAAIRMYSMIDGVLLYSSVDALEQTRERVDLVELLQSIATDLEVPIQKKAAQLEYNSLPDVEGSPILLYQLFYNLVSNALKFMKPGGSPLITIDAGEALPADLQRARLPEGGRYLKIRVSDNGIGFSNTQAEKIFGSFTRLHTKDQYEGTGLGLSLCRKIAERHKGAIYAEGEEGKGATFTLLLPA
jgi:PAS domain S-box-containing protein